VHGRFKGTVAVDGKDLVVNGKKIRLTAERDPANLKWGDVGVDVVVEATAPDGVVEAIRWSGRSFVCGVQWHPEFHLSPGEETQGLLDSGPMMLEFLRAARARADRHRSGTAVVHPGSPLPNST
jgi:hypothetical protein